MIKKVCFFDDVRRRFALSKTISEDESEINIYDYLGFFALDRNTCTSVWVKRERRSNFHSLGIKRR